MKFDRSAIDNLYLSGEYLRKNPTLHAEDSAWKAEIVYPFLDFFVRECTFQQLKLLDVGGGAGLLFRMIADYLAHTHGRSVIQCALDYSPEMLQIQKANNAELVWAQQGSIEETSFHDKQFELVLMIDVLEHLLDADKALREVSRICSFAILKIPLEDTIQSRLMARFGHSNQHATFESVGHVNFYSVENYRRVMDRAGCDILLEKFANIFAYFVTHPAYRSQMTKRQYYKNWLFAKASRMAPRLTARVARDHLIMLVRFRR